MKKSLAIFCIATVVALVLGYIFKPEAKFDDFLKLSMQAMEVALDDTDNAALSSLYSPALLEQISPNNTPTKRDFRSVVTSTVKSGYYSRPQTVYLKSESTLYYTTDGTVPDNSSAIYDSEKGITVEDNTVIYACEYKDGKFGDINSFSYVILKDITDYKYAYGYNCLCESDKVLYKIIYDSMESFERKIVFGNRGITYSKIQKIVRCVNYDNPLLFQAPLAIFSWHGTSDNVTSIMLSYDYESDEVTSYREKVKKRVDEILLKADGSCSLVEYIDKIRTEIMLGASYDDTYSMYNSYECIGVLIDRYGVCESYSRAFQYACRRIGVECIPVVGQSKGEGHMWNMLRLENDWYHMDLTWDDGLYNTVYNDFFNINDRTLRQYGERTIDPEIDDNMITKKVLEFYNVYPVPEANGKKYSYFNYLRLYKGNN